MPAGRFYCPESQDYDDHSTAVLARDGLTVAAACVVPQAGLGPDGVCGVRASALLAGVPPARSPVAAPLAMERWFSDFWITQVPIRPKYDPKLRTVDIEVQIAPAWEGRGEGWRFSWSGFRRGFYGASSLLKPLALAAPVLLLFAALLWAATSDAAKQRLQSRAAMVLRQDFQEDMEGWFGGRDWSRSWERRPEGYALVGQLALYRPTMGISDYEMEFVAQIERQSVGWVVRAADLQNYYAMKLAIVEPGPLPVTALTRYAIVAGQESQRVQVPIRIVLHDARPYRIHVKAAGGGFTTSIDSKVVDFWSDERLKTGGVGFFTEGNDRARLYWMSIEHNNDFWGKVCGFLALRAPGAGLLEQAPASAALFSRAPESSQVN
jgi:hypothetical protein